MAVDSYYMIFLRYGTFPRTVRVIARILWLTRPVNALNSPFIRSCPPEWFLTIPT